MDTTNENQAPRTGLRPPTKIQLPSSPSRNTALGDMTDATANSRVPMMSANGSIKHKPSSLPEPPNKHRKTLKERAEEFAHSRLAAPSSTRPVNGAVKGVVANGTRPFSQSTSRVPSANSNASRNTSASSFGSSMGPSARAPATNGRPKTAYGHARSKSHHQGQRPLTSHAQHDDDPRPERKGAYNSLIVSTDEVESQIFDDGFLRPLKPRPVLHRVASVPDALLKRSLSATPTSGFHTFSSSIPVASPALGSPTRASYDDVTDALGALTLGASAVDGRSSSRSGRGIASGKDSDSSSQFPSSLPRPKTPVQPPPLVSHRPQSCTPKRRQRKPPPQSPFLRKDTNDRAPVFDPEDRLARMERELDAFKQSMERDTSDATNLKEEIKTLQSRVAELEAIRSQITAINDELKSDLRDAKSYMATANMELETTRRNHTFEVDDMRRKYRNDMEDLQEKYRKEADKLRRQSEEAADKQRKEFEAQIDKLLKMHADELETVQKKLKSQVEEEQGRRSREAQAIESEFKLKLQNAGLEADTKERENQLVKGELTNTKAELDRERGVKTSLQHQLSEAAALNLTLDASNKAMKAKIDFLESDSQAQSEAFNDLHRRMEEAIEAAEAANEKLRQEEALRRRLHNQVQELKGNIRVMCRVRPTNPDTENNPATILYPDSNTDSKEVTIMGQDKKSAMGTVTTANYAYSFDRVFGPKSQNNEVFEEISQLVQSALDGYNVCIFCYGQTGSGKTFTMSSEDGMIPRATRQIYAEAERLEEKGWRYQIEGNFVEVYNETYNDLLGRSEDLDKKKLEIRHDSAKKSTTIENAVSVLLDSPDRVSEIMRTADKNRSVAATRANSRSSRSHSVFILKLVGVNSVTGERSEGTLNLVDLAGSERLEHSKVEGARLKETQNINKSLSCLGDVINALGSSKEGGHVPYRNSKLTYLLQYSLGGNSKTLMFVMVSPLQAHLQESLTSLKFATKVYNTHIGTAKKQTKTG